jgi:undecaprenyl-diphosphatase
MSELVEAIILGIVQGLTEFLPVSSSGHLEIGNYIFGTERSADEDLLFIVTLHAATALSTIFVFRQDIFEILKGVFQPSFNDSKRFAIAVIISMIPAAIVGLFFDDFIAQFFNQNLLLIGFMLLVTAALLLFADRAKNTNRSVGFMDAIIVGLAQAVATLPGISRSGATIATSVLLGIDRAKAARFSFLMVVPLIFGKMAKDILDGTFTNNTQALPLIGGFIAALITGYFACTWMIALVKKSKLSYFSWYCLVVGLIAIGAYYFK